jgi:AcrR family transcriptional regulator
MSVHPDLHPPGLRERKKMERRRAIEAAALDLFDRQGFDATTTEQIANAADIAPRTFFSYFPTKEDVVLADYAQRLERIVDELARRPASEGPWDALRASLLAVAVDYEAEREQLMVRFRIMAECPSVFARSLALQAGWEDTLVTTMADRLGAEPGDLTPRLMAAAALAAMRSSIRHWLVTGHAEPLPWVVSDCFERLGRGFSGVR